MNVDGPKLNAFVDELKLNAFQHKQLLELIQASIDLTSIVALDPTKVEDGKSTQITASVIAEIFLKLVLDKIHHRVKFLHTEIPGGTQAPNNTDFINVRASTFDLFDSDFSKGEDFFVTYLRTLAEQFAAKIIAHNVTQMYSYSLFLPVIDFVGTASDGCLEIRCARQYVIAEDRNMLAFDCILKKV